MTDMIDMTESRRGDGGYEFTVKRMGPDQRLKRLDFIAIKDRAVERHLTIDLTGPEPRVW